MRVLSWAVLSLCSACISSSGGRVAPTLRQARFAHPDDIMIAPDSINAPRLIPGQYPVIPSAVLRSGMTEEVIFAFVVDTSGRVEPSTISVIQKTLPDSSSYCPEAATRSLCAARRDQAHDAADLEAAVCSWIADIRFVWPQSPGRALLVFPFRMMAPGVPASQVDESANVPVANQMLRTTPKPQLLGWLEKQTHCS